MTRINRETINTPYGTAIYYKRGKNYSYAITLTNIKIPKNSFNRLLITRVLVLHPTFVCLGLLC
jgi:hypothetical protein